MGSTVFFTADDGVHGRDLWKTDGTKAGTSLVKAFDTDDDEYYGSAGPSRLTAAGGRLFFVADDGVHGEQLWKSDGTTAGTVMVKEIVSGPGGEYGYSDGPDNLTAVGGTLFFTVDGLNGHELWKSNGSKAGTMMVKNIGNVEGYYDETVGLTNVGGTLFLAADDGVHGRELWKSDGTTAGTVMVKDIRPGEYPSEPSGLTAVGSTLFFVARDGVHGQELWKSDGSPGGTVLVEDISPGTRRSNVRGLTAVGGALFFAADDGTHGRELWTSDGSEVGTTLVKDISPDLEDNYYSGPQEMAGVGGTLFFSTTDADHGEELWKSNGTEVGTVMVKDINPGEYSSYSTNLTASGGKLFFTARDGVHGPELWTSDGDEAGTVLVKDIQRQIYGNPGYLTDVAGTLFFTADDAIHGRELWRSDGTPDGTVMVRDVNAGGGFEVAKRGRANTRTGSLKVAVTTEGAGRLVVRPAAGSLLKKVVKDIGSAGTTRVVLKPTAAGLAKLQRDGALRVKARFVFTPCGGPSSAITRAYTLRLR